MFQSNLFLSGQWKPSCSKWTGGWTDSHRETNTRFSEMCEMPDVVDFLIHIKHSQDTDLRFAELKRQILAMT